MDIIETLKQNRDIEILNPSITDLNNVNYNPMNIKNMEEIVDLINVHKEFDSNILVFTDYDVDGIIGGFILYHYLKFAGSNVQILTSNRKYGYGLSEHEISQIIDSDIELVITVDCGITQGDKISMLTDNDIDVIVTDHHEYGGTPEFPFINPKVGGSYIQRDLSGAGVAFKLVCALEEDIMEEYLDLLAIANISDFVPLLGENRITTKLGINKINSNPFHTLGEMLRELEISKVDASTVSYQIAPLINSVNRLKHSHLPIRILEGENIPKLTADMVEINERRKNKVKRAIETLEYDTSHNIIIAQGTFTSGFTGLIASKIQDKHKLPVIALNQSLKGSGRSVKPLHLIDTLRQREELFETLGGHEMAAGFQLKEGRVDKLKEFMYNYTEGIEYETRNPDIVLKDTSSLNLSLLDGLDILRPFGAGNPPPLFKLDNAKLNHYNETRSGEHLQMEVEGEKAIWFNYDKSIDLRDRVDIYFEIQEDTFRGRGIQLIVKEVKTWR